DQAASASRKRQDRGFSAFYEKLLPPAVKIWMPHWPSNWRILEAWPATEDQAGKDSEDAQQLGGWIKNWRFWEAGQQLATTRARICSALYLNSIGVPEQQFFGLRYQDSRKTLVFLQTIQDIQSGAVVVPRDKAPRLAALMLQSYHGDFDHQMGFPLNNYSLLRPAGPASIPRCANMYRIVQGSASQQGGVPVPQSREMVEGYGRVNFRVLPVTLCIETTGIVLRSQSASAARPASS
uniref:Alpha-amylase n=1 Tax=Macrostomum lignano TaxID=282301 RepID=A0A1I8F8K2_9PLAT